MPYVLPVFLGNLPWSCRHIAGHCRDGMVLRLSVTWCGPQCRCYGPAMPASRLAVVTPRFGWIQAPGLRLRRTSPVLGWPPLWIVPQAGFMRLLHLGLSSPARGLPLTAARGLATWLVLARACSCTAPTMWPARAAVVGNGTVVPRLHHQPPWPAPWVAWRPPARVSSNLCVLCYSRLPHCGGHHRAGSASCIVTLPGWEPAARRVVVDGSWCRSYGGPMSTSRLTAGLLRIDLACLPDIRWCCNPSWAGWLV